MGIVKKERLKVLRVKADLTQEELSAKSGITARSIVEYEKDVSNLRKARYDTVEKLANALGVSIDEIFLG